MVLDKGGSRTYGPPELLSEIVKSPPGETERCDVERKNIETGNYLHGEASS
jgi:hypothetical protein